MVDHNFPTPVGPDAAPLHYRQADGLRHLADMLDGNPHIAYSLRYAMEMLAPLINPDENPRQALVDFHRAATAAGAHVTLTNSLEQAKVTAEFGNAVSLKMFATADLLAGTAAPPKYLPVEVDVAGDAS